MLKRARELYGPATLPGSFTVWMWYTSLTHRQTLSDKPLTHSLSLSLTHSLTQSLTHSLIHSSTHSFIHPLTHSLTHSLTHLLTLSLSHSFTHSLTLSLSHSFTHSFIHSLTHSLTHSFTHSLTHSLTHLLIYTHLIYSSFHIIFCSTYSYHAILVWCTSTATRATYGTRWLPKGWEDLDYSQQWGTLYWLEAGREPQKVNLTQTICLRHRKGHQRVFAKFTS